MMTYKSALSLLIAASLLLISHADLDADSVTLPPNAPRSPLATETTQAVLSVWKDTPYLEILRDPKQNWNWLPSAVAVPLPARASGKPLTWHFQDAKADSSQGNKITLRFTCDDPKLELLSIWWAHPGPGPIEYKSTIKNESGSDVSFADQDIVAADLQLVADAGVTLHRFCKLADVRNDDRAGTPVISVPVGPDYHVTAYTRNGTNDHPADIPMQFFDVDSKHGLYLGYEWSFGQFEIGSQTDARHLTYRAFLWHEGEIKLAKDRTLTVPPIYLGTYTGDLDDGGNQFKRWFWKYKMTATLRDNPGEPLLEYCVPGNEKDLARFFADYPVKDWGGELAKVDIDWLPKGIGPDQDWASPLVSEWNPDPGRWPNGMKAREMALRAGQPLSLYMPNSYQLCDLATDEGREKDKDALFSRYDKGWFDYYRSDFTVEGADDYLKHEGFLDVLDSLIAKYPHFRYEHCSDGGTLKDFSTLQRLTFMTTEDSATPDGHRKAMYSCTYTINPVQLKADVAIAGGPGSVDDPHWVRYCLRTGFMGANMATSWGVFSPTMAAETKLAWPLYKEKMRPLLRGADVYHILPAPNGVDWDGLEYDNPALQQGTVLLFKPSAKAVDSQVIKLKGLDPNASYALTFQDRPSQNTTQTGAQLMGDGLKVADLTGDYASEIIWLKKTGP
jgi:hypothetical protein